jgi:WD40 repeat protein
VLTANPTSLSAGQYFARVTVSSPDASVGNQEVIRVGLTVGSTNPPAMVTASPGVSARTVVTNPVEPEAFAAIGSSISVYNTYSGALLRTFSGSSNTILALTISDDGQKLYVLQNASAGRDILALNAATGAVEATYHIDSTFYDPGIQYIRPDTRPVLLSTVSADAFDLTTGTRYPQQVEGPGIAVSPDQRHIYTHNTGISASTIKSYLARFSTLNNLGLQITEVGNDFFDHINTSRGNGQDIALSADGTTLFSAAGAPYQFDVLEAATLRTTGAFPGDAYPNNVEVSWNGLVAAGSTSTSNPQGNIWVYNQTGTLLSRLSSGDDALAQRALRFSGDGTRIVSPATAGIRFQAAPNPPP